MVDVTVVDPESGTPITAFLQRQPNGTWELKSAYGTLNDFLDANQDRTASNTSINKEEPPNPI
jgi:hypothetical protein